MTVNFHPMQEKQLAMYKNVQNQLDARKTKTASSSARRSFMLRQKNSNHSNELNRLRGVYNNTNVRQTKTQIEGRFAELTKLGAQATGNIQD